MSTLALVPAKRQSEGVPDKNWKPIHPDGRHCAQMAIDIGAATCDTTVITSDSIYLCRQWALERPKELCQPDTPMIDVVRHALEHFPGPDDEIIVLLQPTSPLRTAATVKQAIQMLRDEPTATSVVSVAPSYPLQWSMVTENGFLQAFDDFVIGGWPSRRQDCKPTWKRDGVVYAFRRSTLADGPYGFYGICALPLYTPPEESLSIDTPADWDEAVRRLSTRTALGV